MTSHIGGRNDLAVMNVEAVGKGQRGTLFEVGLDVLFIERSLLLVVDEDHDDIGGLDGVTRNHDLEAGGGGGVDGFGALVEPDDDVGAGILQVERVGVALAAVTDDRDGLALENAEIAVLFVVHVGHLMIPPVLLCMFL